MRPLFLALLIALFSLPAQAQDNCQNAMAARTMLAAEYGEQQVGIGLLPNGNIVELWINPETRSWTIMGVLPQGIACLLSSGESWIFPDVQPEQGSDS